MAGSRDSANFSCEPREDSLAKLVDRWEKPADDQRRQHAHLLRGTHGNETGCKTILSELRRGACGQASRGKPSETIATLTLNFL